MNCDWCDESADYAIEKEGVKVGLCTDHLLDLLPNYVKDIENQEEVKEIVGRLSEDK